MYRKQLETIARNISATSSPFPSMPTFMAGVGENGEWFIADNGDEEFTVTRDEFVRAFPDIAIYDLNVHFDNDEAAVNAAIEEAI